MTLKKGLFLTIDGADGAGKGTQVALLEQRLLADGFEVSMFRDPGGTAIGEELRAIVKASTSPLDKLTEFLIFNAARNQLVKEKILPALAQGQVVICDRFFDSTVAYQGFGRGIPLELVGMLIDNTAVEPDKTFLFCLDRATCIERIRARSADAADRFDGLGTAFFDRVAEGFEHQAQWYPERIVKVDASLSIEEVQSSIWLTVAGLLRERA